MLRVYYNEVMCLAVKRSILKSTLLFKVIKNMIVIHSGKTSLNYAIKRIKGILMLALC